MLNEKLHFLCRVSIEMKTNQMFTINDSLNYLKIFCDDHGSVPKIGITNLTTKNSGVKTLILNTACLKQVQRFHMVSIWDQFPYGNLIHEYTNTSFHISLFEPYMSIY